MKISSELLTNTAFRALGRPMSAMRAHAYNLSEVRRTVAEFLGVEVERVSVVRVRRQLSGGAIASSHQVTLDGCRWEDALENAQDVGRGLAGLLVPEIEA